MDDYAYYFCYQWDCPHLVAGNCDGYGGQFSDCAANQMVRETAIAVSAKKRGGETMFTDETKTFIIDNKTAAQNIPIWYSWIANYYDDGFDPDFILPDHFFIRFVLDEEMSHAAVAETRQDVLAAQLRFHYPYKTQRDNGEGSELDYLYKEKVT